MVERGSASFWRVLGLLGDSVRKSGTGYEARCPAHEDRHASLSVGVGYDGRVLLSCHAGCSTDQVLAALGLEFGDLFEKSAAGNPVRRFRLINGAGEAVAEHVREDLPTSDKEIHWEHNGKRGLNGTRTEDLPLYRLPELLAADPATPVIVTEGEKAAEALVERFGLLAVATVTGASTTPSAGTLAPLQGREVWLWPDNDDPGREHMARIAQRITPPPKWICWPDAPGHGDAADYVELVGASVAGIQAMVTEGPPSHVPPPIPTIKIWRATELAAASFDPTRWAIPDLLPAGLAILAGRPKLGKSWLCLGWAIDIARGAPPLKKMRATQGETLYLALEDGPQRMQERISLMLGDWAVPPGLHIATDWPRMPEGGLDLLGEWLTGHPTARLVVIDTFKRVRPKEKSIQRLYDLDYDAITPVAALAREHNVAIVVVFHTRKGESDDPLELVSGTLGLSGAADCVIVLRRERGQADASLFVTGRDVEEQDLALRWEKEDVLAWSLLGNAEQFRRSKERQEVLEMVATMPGSTPADIADSLGKPRGSVRYLLFAMVRDAEVRVRDGHYFPRTPNSTNAGLDVAPSLESLNRPIQTPPNTPNSRKPSIQNPISSVSSNSNTRVVSGVSGQWKNCRACGNELQPELARIGLHYDCTLSLGQEGA